MSVRMTMLVTLLTSLLHGCAVGPDYAPSADYAVVVAATQPASLARWWERFDDEDLNGHIELALANNLELDAARAAVREARASRAVARSALWPSLNAEAGYTWSQQSINSPTGAGPLIGAGLVDRDVEFWSSSLNGRWDADLFGATRRLDEAARAAVQQGIAARDAVALGVVAETASAWFELRGASARREKVERNAQLQRESLQIIEGRARAGLSRELDALRARAQLEATLAALPPLDASIRASAYRLSVLTGATLDAVATAPERIAPSSALPPVPDRLPTQVAAGFLRERPDVAAAERHLAARVAELGVAEASFYPQLYLQASAGLESASLSDLASGDSRVLGLAPRISLPIFQGGRLRANRRAAMARADAAYANLQQVLLAGMAEAHTGLALVDGELKTLRHVSASARASHDAEHIARLLYERGLGDYLALLDAQRQLAEREDHQVQVETRLRLQLVRLYTALGGDARNLLGP